jgi:hypothetical protein
MRTTDGEPVELRNSFRFADAPRWFDFYNCRVVLPERQLFFYTMPFVLSGVEAERGCWVYDGGNGGPEGRSICAVERLPEGEIQASRDFCDARWRARDGRENLFSARRIRLSGPGSQWDVTMEPFLSDDHEPDKDRRRFDIAERFLLQRVPFIHRVPQMKAFASGTIVQGGRTHHFERGVVYQAKNHGHGFPDTWLWIHANAFASAPELAIEAAALSWRGGKVVTLARVATPERVVAMSSLTGDDVGVEFDGQQYKLRAAAKDGTVEFRGEGKHSDEVVFSFPAPQGGLFESRECFIGQLAVRLHGRDLTTNMAALAHARWIPPGHTSTAPTGAQP